MYDADIQWNNATRNISKEIAANKKWLSEQNKQNQTNLREKYGRAIKANEDASLRNAQQHALSLAGDGTNLDGQTKQISCDGYNFTLVNRGGVWQISSSQKMI